MRSELVIVASPGRLPRIEARGGLTGRCTEPDTVHLVSTAATPLGGDTMTVRVTVEPGARLRIRTVAATVALPGADTARSTVRWDIDVAGQLDLDPQPTVVADGSEHETSVHLRLAGAAQVRLRERIQIGRSGERAGFWSGLLYADLTSPDAAVPLLRHRIELGSGALGDDVLSAPRACVSELRYPQPSFDAAGTVLQLARGGSLATWQGDRLPPSHC
ncbi:urease accessory protein UreD [Mycobacterium sp. 21AC1]|uniref:urease accessory protein UreD n=1 Tax=[Mycobacterium] appelbergii TaxID=2939269 RepID=UPI00293947F0|nr:urease accessory protein UreD [Mycobacterium sp. 21AC1]MDV3126265.1 urease accessory protein UreD [Mycobacterium sp. 21AC1]